MKLDKCILPMSSSLTGSWASLLQLMFVSHLRLIQIPLQVACVTPSSAAMQAELMKHHSNDAKCGELDWVCIPLVVESYGSWGPEAQCSLSRLAGRLVTRLGQPKSFQANLIYGRLKLTLIRANSRAILSRVCV